MGDVTLTRSHTDKGLTFQAAINRSYAIICNTRIVEASITITITSQFIEQAYLK